MHQVIKIQLPPHLYTTNTQVVSFKITKSTTVRSALKRLYLRFNQQHPEVANYVISRDPGNVPLDEDDFFQAGVHLRYRPLTATEELTLRRSLVLTVLVRGENPEQVCCQRGHKEGGAKSGGGMRRRRRVG